MPIPGTIFTIKTTCCAAILVCLALGWLAVGIIWVAYSVSKIASFDGVLNSLSGRADGSRSPLTPRLILCASSMNREAVILRSCVVNVAFPKDLTFRLSRNQRSFCTTASRLRTPYSRLLRAAPAAATSGLPDVRCERELSKIENTTSRTNGRKRKFAAGTGFRVGRQNLAVLWDLTGF